MQTINSPNGKEPTISLGLRLPITVYQQFINLAQNKKLKPGTLARHWLTKQIAQEVQQNEK